MKIIFLIPQYSNLLDVAGASQAFIEAIEYGADIEITYCSYDSDIETSAGLPLGKLDRFQKHQADAGDYIFVLSSKIDYVLSEEIDEQTALIDWLIKSYDRGANICSVCNGAFILGRTGLLNGKKCTTHWKRTSQLQKLFPLAMVQENILFIEDQRIITSAGATSGIDIALHVLSKIKDDHFAFKISRELVVYKRRSGSQTQQSIFVSHRNHVHNGVHKVQDWLQENIHQRASISELAAMANMSDRNFTRVFKKETSLTVNNYINMVRKERIASLLELPDYTRQQIAKLCGLKSERHVSRLIKK